MDQTKYEGFKAFDGHIFINQHFLLPYKILILKFGYQNKFIPELILYTKSFSVWALFIVLI